MQDANQPVRLGKAALTQQIGQSGLSRYGGFIFDILDAPPPGKTWLDVYHLMSVGEPVIVASLATFETLASRVMWTMQPADETAQKFLPPHRRPPPGATLRTLPQRHRRCCR